MKKESLKLSQQIYRLLVSAAEKEKPLEACGILGGTAKKVRQFYPMTNMDKSSESYSMDPWEQFKVLEELRRKGWDIAGIWHSHLHTPPCPSTRDKELAFTPETSYVILSLAPGHYGEIRSFYREKSGNLVEEDIVMV